MYVYIIYFIVLNIRINVYTMFDNRCYRINHNYSRCNNKL